MVQKRKKKTVYEDTGIPTQKLPMCFVVKKKVVTYFVLNLNKKIRMLVTFWLSKILQ